MNNGFTGAKAAQLAPVKQQLEQALKDSRLGQRSYGWSYDGSKLAGLIETIAEKLPDQPVPRGAGPEADYQSAEGPAQVADAEDLPAKIDAAFRAWFESENYVSNGSPISFAFGYKAALAERVEEPEQNCSLDVVTRDQIYQVTGSSGYWEDVDKSEFDRSSPSYRRIVYNTPITAQPADGSDNTRGEFLSNLTPILADMSAPRHMEGSAHAAGPNITQITDALDQHWLSGSVLERIDYLIKLAAPKRHAGDVVAKMDGKYRLVPTKATPQILAEIRDIARGSGEGWRDCDGDECWATLLDIAMAGVDGDKHGGE